MIQKPIESLPLLGIVILIAPQEIWRINYWNAQHAGNPRQRRIVNASTMIEDLDAVCHVTPNTADSLTPSSAAAQTGIGLTRRF
jgi:hypothetical protein